MRGNGGPCREDPFQRQRRVVAQTKARQIEWRVIRVVQFDPILCIIEAVSQRQAVAGHELGDLRWQRFAIHLNRRIAYHRTVVVSSDQYIFR